MGVAKVGKVFMSVKEAGLKLGVSENTIVHLIRVGDLGHCKIVKQYRISFYDLCDYVDRYYSGHHIESIKNDLGGTDGKESVEERSKTA